MKNLELNIISSGHGHWKITTTHYGKEISCVTNNSEAVDNAKDGIKSSIINLRSEIIRKNK